MGLRSLRESISILLGRPRVATYASRSPVHTEPDAWRCSRCGGRLVRAPQADLFSHMCNGYIEPARRAVRYMGLRRHARLLWATLWEGRPRIVSAKPPHVQHVFEPEPDRDLSFYRAAESSRNERLQGKAGKP